MIEPMPEARKVEVIDACVRVAGELVVALRESDTAGINRVLAKIPDGGSDVMYLVLAAMVDDARSIKAALAWTENMPDDLARRQAAVATRQRELARERERTRLVLAGVRDPASVEALAGAVGTAQESVHDRMVRITHRGRRAA